MKRLRSLKRCDSETVAVGHPTGAASTHDSSIASCYLSVKV
jgi:hypothetical protein